MFIVTIPKWKLNNNLVQLETKWDYYKDASGQDHVKSVTSNGNSLYSLKDNNVYPEGTIFYIQPTRIFDKKEIKLPMVEVRTKSRNLKDLPVYRDGASIDKPMLGFNKNELQGEDAENLNTFTIKSSQYSGVQSSHLLTNWIVENAFGNVVFKKLNEKIDLLNLNIKRSLLERWGRLVIKCQHVGDNLEASSFGSIMIDIKNGEQFEIERELDDVNPDMDLFIPVTPKEVLSNGVIKSAVFRKLNNMEGNDSIYVDYPVDIAEASKKGGFTLSHVNMGYGNTFMLEIQSVDVKKVMMNTTIPIKTRTETPSKDYIVNDMISLIAIEEKELTSSRTCNVNNFFFTEFEYDKFYSAHNVSNNIFVGEVTRLPQPTQSTIVSEYTVTHKIQMFTKAKDDLKIFSSTQADGSLLYGNNNYLITDTPKSNNIPSFKIYKKNHVTGQYTVYGKLLDRNDEKAPIGKTGSFCIIADEEMLYYAPDQISKFKRINLLKQEVETMDLPTEVQPGCMIYNPIYKKFLFISKKDKLYVLDKWKGTVEEKSQSTFNPEIKEFRFIPMNNDDTLILGLNKAFKLLNMYRYDARSSTSKELDISAIDNTKVSKYKGVVRGYRNEVYLQFEGNSKLYWFRYE